MAHSKLYTVQPISEQDQSQATNSTSVFADGPLQAARMVLGPAVTTRGSKDSLCGRVWELRDDLTPTYTELFRSAGKATVGKVRRKILPSSANAGEWMVLLKILAICAVVVAASCLVVMRYGA